MEIEVDMKDQTNEKADSNTNGTFRYSALNMQSP
jgi:hypothetical protein